MANTRPRSGFGKTLALAAERTLAGALTGGMIGVPGAMVLLGGVGIKEIVFPSPTRALRIELEETTPHPDRVEVYHTLLNEVRAAEKESMRRKEYSMFAVTIPYYALLGGILNLAYGAKREDELEIVRQP